MTSWCGSCLKGQKLEQGIKGAIKKVKAATTIQKVIRGNNGRAKAERFKTYENTIKDMPISSNLIKRSSKRGYLEILDKEPSLKTPEVSSTRL